MRTLTADQTEILTKRNRAVFVRAWVDRGSSDWVDLTDLEGRDWVQGVEYGASVEQAAATATVSLFNRVDNLNLAPLVDGSKLNASGTILDLGHPIYVETATMPQDTPPSSGDWVEVFRGEIDAIDWERNPIRLRCRDESGVLDRFIESQVKRPFDVAVAPVEDVMQEILDGELGEGVVTLFSITGDATTPFKAADSPGWMIPEYIQKKQPLIQALRVLADQIGWVVRYLWNDNTSAFELTFYEPGRELAARGTLSFTGQPTATETWVLNSTTMTAVAASPSTDEFEIGSTVAETMANIVTMLEAGSESGNIAAAWALAATYAEGTLTFTGQPSATETFVVNATTITAVAGAPANNQFQIGGTLTDTLDNIVTTLNSGCDESGNLLATRIGSTVRIQWGTAGSAGDAIVFTEALSNCTADGGGTLGGTTAGIDGGVTIEWGTKGTAGNSITFTEAMSNCTADGGGTLGGTISGQDVTSGYTFGPDNYFSLGRMATNRAGIRNVISIKFGASQLDRTKLEVSDSASIAKYGRRFMEIAEAGSSQIDTESEARSMADAILADLSEPEADHAVELPYFWPVEPSDYQTFEANGYHYDTDQSLAVVSYRHQLTGNRSRTVINSRGKPSGGFKRWLELDARPGIADQNNFYTNNAAEGQATSQGVGLIVVTYDDPRGMSPPINDWAFTKCHVSTSSGFTPSGDNLEAAGKMTRFEIGGKVPGTTYYVKLVIIDSAGNEALTSTQVSTATEKVGAYHENSDTIKINLVPNGAFGQATRAIADYPPDGWDVTVGSWGTEVTYSTAQQETGNRSIDFTSSGGGDGRILSDFVPVSRNAPYSLYWWLKVSATDNNNRARIGFLTYDKDFSSVGSVLLGAVTPPADWTRYGSSYIPAAGSASTVRYIKLYVERYLAGASGSPGYSLYCDRILCFKQMHKFRGFLDSAQSIPQNTPTQVDIDQQVFDKVGQTIDGTVYGLDTATNVGRFTCNQPGEYTFYAAATLSGLTNGKWFEAKLYKNGSPDGKGTRIFSTGTATVRAVVAAEITLARDDYVDLYVEHDDTASRSLVTGATETYFAGARVSGDE